MGNGREQDGLQFGGKREVSLALRAADGSDVRVDLCHAGDGARLKGSTLVATGSVQPADSSTAPASVVTARARIVREMLIGR